MQGEQKEKTGDIEDLSHKLFITNLDGRIPEQDLHDELSSLFEKHGRITKLSVKRNKGGRYSFAFLQFAQAKQAADAIKNLDQHDFHGKAMRVRPDRPTNGCFHCKRQGHQARECPYKDDNGGPRQSYNRKNRYYDRRDSRRSRSRQNYRHDYNRNRRDNYHRHKQRKSYSYSQSRSNSKSSSSSKGHYRPEVRSNMRSSRSQQRRSKSYSRESSSYRRQRNNRPKRYDSGRDYNYRQYDRRQRQRQSRSRSREYERRKDKPRKYRERSYS